MSSQPLVSVIIPAFNAAVTIARAMESALAQTYHPIEVIVVDDCSTDATVEIISAHRDKRIRLLRLPHNHGEGGVVNEGITIARGEYIAFLDADDEWLPEKLSIQIPILAVNLNATMVTCGARIVGEAGNTTLEWAAPPPGLEKREIWRGLLAASYVFKPCVVARASALRTVGPFDTTIKIAADQDMWIRLAMEGEVEFIPEPLTVVHDTPGSLTKVYAAETHRYVLPMICRHIERRRQDLSDDEVRYILGARYTSVGRTLYRNGVAVRGAMLLGRAILLRAFVLENLLYLITASPPMHAVKKGLIRCSAWWAASWGRRPSPSA